MDLLKPTLADMIVIIIIIIIIEIDTPQKVFKKNLFICFVVVVVIISFSQESHLSIFINFYVLYKYSIRSNRIKNI